MLIVIGLPSTTLEADREKLDTLGMVSSVIVPLAVMLLYLVPEMVALMLNVAEMPTLRDPSALCATVRETVPRRIVLPPPLEIAGEVKLEAVPSIVHVLDRVLMLRDQLASCTRYIFAVIVLVFAVIF
jgi:hypothetical protein